MRSVSFYRDPNVPFFELKLCNTNDLCYKKHYHDEYLLAIVETGVSRFCFGSSQVPIGAGDLVLIPPVVIHSCNPFHKEQWKYKMLSIDNQWVQEFIASCGQDGVTEPLISKLSKVGIDKMVSQFECLKGDAAPLEKESIIMDMFTKVFYGIHKKHQVVFDTNERKSKLKEVREYLDGHFKERVTLDDLENVSGLSKFHMVRLFKREYKIPPHAYQTLLRVNHAKRELLQQESIATVALDVGFFDQSHFNKIFKYYVGTTPENYQKSL